MSFLLSLLSILAFLAAANTWLQSTTVMHQIYAALQMLLAGVLFTGAAVVDAVDKLRKIAKQKKVKIYIDSWPIYL